MTDTAAAAETLSFQAETHQLLKLMIHSLYSNKEIFLRELISNASDACDKRRFLALSDPALADSSERAIELVIDKPRRTLAVRDTGIGMSRQELVDHLGTIARSGTRQFLESLSGDQKKDAQLIGQFGVGFYSAFIVADEVEVLTRRAGTAEAWRWRSKAEGTFTLEPAEKAEAGTEVILHLKPEEDEFLEPLRLETLVKRYSDHIAFPIRLEGKVLNQAQALWMRPKAELKDEDYRSFYRHLTHDWEDPIAWAHHKVEGALEYTSLLYVPKRPPFDLWDREQARGVRLYVKRVFILDRAAELLPPYLRFFRGLVDSADLPLNVSREMLQGHRTVEKLKSALTKRALDLLEELARDRPEAYAEVWKPFGAVLKEGIVEDPANRERLARLLRFASTAHPEGATVSLADYVARMPQGQPAIYVLTAETLTAARNSPHLEGFRQKGWEVLLLTDRIDEWVLNHLTEFEGKKLVSAAVASKDLESLIETPEREQQKTAFADTLKRLGETLKGRIAEARLSGRLTESPACLVAPEHGLSRRMEALLRQSGQAAALGLPASLPILELNPTHPLVARLPQADEAQFTDVAELLYGQAVLAEGGQLEDPAGFVRRLNALLLKGVGETPSGIVLQ